MDTANLFFWSSQNISLLVDWFFFLLKPFLILFVFPVTILIFLYFVAIFLYIYRYRRRQIYTAYSENFWDGAVQTIAAIFDTQATFWHGYEIIGLDKIPDQGAAMLIYYHGAMPIDMYYIATRILLVKKRLLFNVVATFLFKFPGFRIFLDVFKCTPGRKEDCLQLLKGQNLLAISPGGVREALFSDENYTVIWNKRCGFAKVALEAQVPIIPVFTENIREALRTIQTGKKFFQWIYERTKIPLVPIYGGFPVKLRTYVGDPIAYEKFSSCSPQEVAAKVEEALRDLILRHQRIPGNIYQALKDRWQPRKNV